MLNFEKLKAKSRLVHKDDPSKKAAALYKLQLKKILAQSNEGNVS